jgi:hypothetical protein
LYECGNWALTLWKEHKFRESENRVLRRTVGPKEEGSDISLKKTAQ